jgi:hypothetical protein
MRTFNEPVTIPLVGVFAQMLGAWYPRDYLVATIAPGDGPGAVQALIAAGFGANAVELHDSARVCQIGATIYAQRTPIQRAGAAVSREITDEGLLSQEYIGDAKRGRSIISVRCPEESLVEQAREILDAHGAQRMRYYGAQSITALS